MLCVSVLLYYYTIIYKFSQIALWGPMVAITVVVAPISTVGFELPKVLVAASFSLCAAIYLLIKREDTVGVLMGSLPGKFLIGYCVVLLLSLLWSIAPVMSIVGAAPRFQGVAFHVSLVCLTVLFALVSKTTKGLGAIEDAFVISNLLMVGYGVLQMMQMDPLSSLWQSEAFLGRIFSTIGHPNSLGQCILLTSPFLVRRLYRTESRTQKLVWASLCLMNIVVLFGTVSRSAMLALALVVLFFVPNILRWCRGCIKNVSKITVVTSVLIVLLLVAVGSLFFIGRFSKAPVEARSTSARVVMINSAVHMIQSRPLGYGLETLSLVTPQFIGKDIYAYESLTTIVDRMHSTPLDVLVMLGPLGLVMYYGLICTLLWQLWIKRMEEKGEWHMACLVGIASYSIALLFGFASIASAVLCAALIGLGIGITGNVALVPRLCSALWNVCMVVCCFAAFAIATQWTLAQLYHASAAQFEGTRALAYEQQGIMSFTYDRKALMEATEHHIQSYATEHSSELAQSIEVLQEMHRKLTNGHDGVYLLLQSWYLAEQGRDEEARISLQNAEQYLPESITYHRTAIFVAGVLHDEQLAAMHTKKLIKLLPDGFFIEGSEMRRILLKQHPWISAYF